jgi:dipeptidyl-peptidase-3
MNGDGHDPAGRRYFIEQIDDAAVVQYYADGFNALARSDKVLCWHLYQAAIAGRDIYYDQRYRHGLAMREIIEEILVHHPRSRASEPGRVIDEIRRYAKLFWMNSGPYGAITARKFVLTCTPAELLDAAHEAARQGARFPLDQDETIDELLARLEDAFFNPDVEPLVTCKTPPAGADILASSANNLYADVTLAALEGFRERYGLNSRLARAPDGQLAEDVYRLNGRYGVEISRIVDHLRGALPFASEPLRRALEALIRAYESGEEDDRVAADIAWVQDADTRVGTVNGFVEVYLDARGVKGAWEALVYYVNPEKTLALERLAADAAWFETQLPVDPQWRRDEVVGVSARAIDVVIETGDAGPMSAVGINLPNDEAVRERYGSKSISLANISAAYLGSQVPALLEEFCWSAQEVARAERWGPTAAEALTAIHEILGHGSGRVAEQLEGRPQLALAEFYSAIEETRADLVALYFLPEPRVAQAGVLPALDGDEVVRTEYEAYARNVLLQLRRVREGTSLEEDHMRNRQLVVNWLLAHTDAIEVRRREGKTFYVVVDVDAFRAGAGRLLHEVQRIKSEGDYDAAKSLVGAYGIHIDAALRDEIVARVDRIRLPSYTGFVQPRLEPVIDPHGHITDVTISYPLDLERQMLEYSGKHPASV